MPVFPINLSTTVRPGVTPMPFVKLDCGILDSTIWFDRECREVFLTALLMASPKEVKEPMPQYQIDDTKPTGFVVPPGWYGFVAAAGPGICARAGVAPKDGMAALEKLGEPEPTSRTPDFQGRRLVRVSGGFIVLNYMTYRERDYTAADRARRYRDRKKEAAKAESQDERRNVTASHQHITQAEAEAEVITTTPLPPSSSQSRRDGAGGSALASALPAAPPAQSSMTRGLPKSRSTPRFGKPDERPPDAPPKYTPRQVDESEVARGENPGGWRDLVPKPGEWPPPAPKEPEP